MASQTTSLRAYALSRLVLAVPMILILLSFVFLLMRVAPGDPVAAALGGKVSQEVLERKRAAMGLDEPIYVQFADYISDVFTLDFGMTITDNRPVLEVILNNGAATLELVFFAMVIATTLGILLGLITGRLRDTPIDVTGRLFGIFVYATPVFFLGFLGQLIFGAGLNWLPASGRASPMVQYTLERTTNLLVLDAIIAGNWTALWDVVRHLIMPATTLGLLITGVLLRMVRVNLLQTLQGDYVEAARARGVSEPRVVYKHAFRNALVPVVTMIGLQFALMMSGAILTETTFNWPGLGNQLVRYLNNRDYTGVQGIITFFAVVVVLISVVIDFVNAWIDPRVRY
ncbi:peptide ABC transporter permease [Rhodovibrio sodomensis]|uniref:Peptide ABC transporter permease n=1 Tax=Rhodovibrio sodomensis TaxID=1088 RepID=A0ABS1DF36_9PROT|nr:ABC transporter permease [Rhodovibrio sodomensis]MBK1668148.1 peptide ABC transporter permease [Rhodovibrio sodomensis]